MRTLVQKEFRENVKLAALGLIIHTLLLLAQCRSYIMSPNSLSQPLADESVLWSTIWFGGIFGAVLGWLQIHNERRPDLWAFLIHRPLTRTEVFLGKALAGLGLYAVVVGAPLLGFIAWGRWPGHVAAPFELTMLRPMATYALTGIVFYFAGMLTGLRQARWYASRALGLGFALIVCLLMMVRPEWWQGFLVILIGTTVLVAANWGGFQTHGYFHGQPASGKAALTLSLMGGALIIAVVAALLLSNFFQESESASSWSHYAVTKDGGVYKVTRGPGQSSEIVDLEGRPYLDAQTRQKVETADFERKVGRHFSVGLALARRERPELWVQADTSLVVGWQATSDTLWYYWPRYGRLVGYDLATRRCIGSLGPQGFARDLGGVGDRFSNSMAPSGERTLATATTLYLVDFDQRLSKPLFTTTADDPILAVSNLASSSDGLAYTAVVTKRFVHLLTEQGQLVWKVPNEPKASAYRWADIYVLEPPGQFALWMSPSREAGEPIPATLPNHVVWVARDQGVVRSADLPALFFPGYKPRPQERLGCAVSPPVALLALPWLKGDSRAEPLPLELLLPAWAGAVLVCLPIGLWLGRRYRFSLAAQAGWAVFHVLFGVPGLLAFLSVQEWPAREACPNCKRLRLVDRVHCEHCGADFAPPEKTGTEVFAPLVAG